MTNVLSILSLFAIPGVPAVLALRYGAESRRGFDERRLNGQQNL